MPQHQRDLSLYINQSNCLSYSPILLLQSINLLFVSQADCFFLGAFAPLPGWAPSHVQGWFLSFSSQHSVTEGLSAALPNHSVGIRTFTPLSFPSYVLVVIITLWRRVVYSFRRCLAPALQQTSRSRAPGPLFMVGLEFAAVP